MTGLSIWKSDTPTGRGLSGIRPLPMSKEDRTFWAILAERRKAKETEHGR